MARPARPGGRTSLSREDRSALRALSRPRRAVRVARARRWVAALLAGLASFVAVSSLSPSRAAERGSPTVVAVRAIPAGAVVSADDVELAVRPADQRPESAFGSPALVVGRTTSGAVAAHEAVTAERLVGPGLLAGRPAGEVAVRLPVLDASGLGLRPGTRVDVYAPGSGDVVAAAAVVLAVDSGSDPGSLTGATRAPGVTLALSPDAAARAAQLLGGVDPVQAFVLALRAD